MLLKTAAICLAAFLGLYDNYYERQYKMSNKERNLLAACEDIKVVDCTIRDGGLVNNFEFTDEFVRDLYTANAEAGVDYMEFGYKASKQMFNEKDFGKWKFCNEKDLQSIVGLPNESRNGPKVAVMADAGRTDYKTDILPRDKSVVDLVRVACYIHQIPLAIDMIEDAKAKGYEVTCNLMALSKISTDDLMLGLDLISKSNVDGVYIVDSFGNLYPEQIERYVGLYSKALKENGKFLGFHGHNNQQLAFANTIEACKDGVDYLDAAVNGLGRGAGNCHLEMLLSFLKNPKYKVVPILDLIQKHILKMKEEGLTYGYDIPYLLTSAMNCHPRAAIQFIKDKRSDYSNFLKEMQETY